MRMGFDLFSTPIALNCVGTPPKIAFIFYSETMRFTLENSWKMILKGCVNHDQTLLWRFHPIFSLQFWVFWRYKQLSKKGLFLKLKVPFFSKKIRREGAPPPPDRNCPPIDLLSTRSLGMRRVPDSLRSSKAAKAGLGENFLAMGVV